MKNTFPLIANPHLPWLNFSPSFPTLLPPSHHPTQCNKEDESLCTHFPPALAWAFHSQQFLQEASTCYGTESTTSCHVCIWSSSVLSMGSNAVSSSGCRAKSVLGHCCHFLLPFSNLNAHSCFLPFLPICVLLCLFWGRFSEASESPDGLVWVLQQWGNCGTEWNQLWPVQAGLKLLCELALPWLPKAESYHCRRKVRQPTVIQAQEQMSVN